MNMIASLDRERDREFDRLVNQVSSPVAHGSSVMRRRMGFGV
jgi:hypothetical protein